MLEASLLFIQVHTITFCSFFFLIKTRQSQSQHPADGCSQMHYNQKTVKSPVWSLSHACVALSLLFLNCRKVSCETRLERLVAHSRNDPGFKKTMQKTTPSLSFARCDEGIIRPIRIIQTTAHEPYAAHLRFLIWAAKLEY